jgi:hypothetical protein
MKIVYPNPENDGVCVITPSGLLTLEETARIDVPPGVPFLYVAASDLPDRYFRNAWEADFSNPDGYGEGR